MKATLRIPDTIHREAMVRAAAQGIPLARFINEAIQEKLRASAAGESRMDTDGR